MCFPRLELVALTVAEVEGMLSGRLPEGRPFAEDGLVPEVVSQEALRRHGSGEGWFWCAPRLFWDAAAGLAVGAGCFMGSPVDAAVEIGYGVAAGWRGRGFATLGVALLAAEAAARGEVAELTAETSVDNPASERALGKNGFVKVGSRLDPEDGQLHRWRLALPGSPVAGKEVKAGWLWRGCCGRSS